MENNPRTIFYRLFGQGDNEVERKAIARESSSILDLVADQAARLERDLGGQDRAMLHDYLDSVREIERRTAKAQDNAKAALKLPDAPLGVLEDFNEQLNMMFELIALAYQANMTRVANFMMAKEVSMRTYNNLAYRRRISPAVPSSERSGKNESPGDDTDLPHYGVCALPQAAGKHAGWRWLDARSLDPLCSAVQ